MRRTGYPADAKAYAEANGYFWLPCPRCGEYFGGHEWGKERASCLLDDRTQHGACCPKRSDENDEEACRRTHERQAKESR